MDHFPDAGNMVFRRAVLPALLTFAFLGVFCKCLVATLRHPRFVYIRFRTHWGLSYFFSSLGFYSGLFLFLGVFGYLLTSVKLNLEDGCRLVYFRVMQMRTVKIKEETLNKMKEHIDASGQTITAFIDIAVTNELKKIAQERMVLSSYASNMAPVLSKAINGTRKTKRK